MPIVHNSEFEKRRTQLLATMRLSSAALLPAATIKYRNNDNEYPFRQDSDFYYLTGMCEPNAVLLLIKKDGCEESILFNQPSCPEKALWTGPMLGQLDACEQLGVDHAFSIDTLDEKLPQLLLGCDELYYAFGKNTFFDGLVGKYFEHWRQQYRRGAKVPLQITDLDSILHEQRLIKSDYEIDCMRKAAAYSANAHCQAMRACRPNQYEYEIQAVIEYEMLVAGCQRIAYPSIVATGENACILHYTKNASNMSDGELVLIDAGAEYNYYASDITRTFPVNGQFNTEQTIIYDLVLAAQLAGIEKVKPGALWSDIQLAIVECVTKGLLNIGVLQGDLPALIEAEAYRSVYMHSSGHWLGLDVHDVGRYKINEKSRKLEAGMVLTVEPGIYFSPQLQNIDSKWLGIGVRIEDDILVTPTGYEVLSAGVPKSISEIEAIMAEK